MWRLGLWDNNERLEHGSSMLQLPPVLHPHRVMPALKRTMVRCCNSTQYTVHSTQYTVHSTQAIFSQKETELLITIWKTSMLTFIILGAEWNQNMARTMELVAMELVAMELVAMELVAMELVAMELVAMELVAMELVAMELVAMELVAMELVAMELVAMELVAMELVAMELLFHHLYTCIKAHTVTAFKYQTYRRHHSFLARLWCNVPSACQRTYSLAGLLLHVLFFPQCYDGLNCHPGDGRKWGEDLWRLCHPFQWM